MGLQGIEGAPDLVGGVGGGAGGPAIRSTGVLLDTTYGTAFYEFVVRIQGRSMCCGRCKPRWLVRNQRSICARHLNRSGNSRALVYRGGNKILEHRVLVMDVGGGPSESLSILLVTVHAWSIFLSREGAALSYTPALLSMHSCPLLNGAITPDLYAMHRCGACELQGNRLLDYSSKLSIVPRSSFWLRI